MSFSIEDRNPAGQKRSAFYSLTASRNAEETPKGWDVGDGTVVRAILSRQVVAATYEDAFRRKVLPVTPDLIAERDAILQAYEQKIAQLLSEEKPETK